MENKLLSDLCNFQIVPHVIHEICFLAAHDMNVTLPCPIIVGSIILDQNHQCGIIQFFETYVKTPNIEHNIIDSFLFQLGVGFPSFEQTSLKPLQLYLTGDVIRVCHNGSRSVYILIVVITSLMPSFGGVLFCSFLLPWNYLVNELSCWNTFVGIVLP